MRALILAAGVGKRLGPLGMDQPKSLLRIGEKSLLQRHIDNLHATGVSELVIGVGHRADMMQAALAEYADSLTITTVHNPHYTEGSVISLWSLRQHLNAGGDVLLMDADVLYHPEILRRLLSTSIANCFLLDREFEVGEEPVKLCVRNGMLVEFRKQIDPDLTFDFRGESVGFFRFSASKAQELAQKCEEYLDTGRRDAPCEEPIRDLLLAAPQDFGYEDVSGLPWIEIDYPKDLERARSQVLPSIG